MKKLVTPEMIDDLLRQVTLFWAQFEERQRELSTIEAIRLGQDLERDVMRREQLWIFLEQGHLDQVQIDQLIDLTIHANRCLERFEESLAA